MNWDFVLVAFAVALAFGAICYFAGRRHERRDLWAEVCAAARYKQACRDVLMWCCQKEFRAARRVAAHIMAHGEGESLNAGTPCGDEPCTVNGLREQLRKINADLHGAAAQRAGGEAGHQAPQVSIVNRGEPMVAGDWTPQTK
jgi:hypothetical protein